MFAGSASNRDIYWPRSAILLLAALSALGCPQAVDVAEKRPPHHPWIVIGIDGADWAVIEELWRRDQLPNLRALVDAGVRAHMTTDYAASPVIWTTIATGRRPEVHGISNFVVQTPRGDVPVSSGVRRAPALWNMLDLARRRTLVLGWWATWPAEEISGIVVSDRALEQLENRVSPPEWLPQYETWAGEALKLPNEFGGNAAAKRRDQVMAELALRLSTEPFDLTLVYFRGVDIESHNSWKFWQPERFGVSEEELQKSADLIPAVYRATDTAIGRIVGSAGGLDSLRANLLVISDHGFFGLEREELQILLDMNRVLEHLGWLERRPDGGIDLGRSRVYSFGSAKNRLPKRMRFSLVGREEGGTVSPESLQEVRGELETSLARLTWRNGSPAFAVGDADLREQGKGTDFFVYVLEKGASETIFLDDLPVPGLVEKLGRISGSHSRHTKGILIAAGPDLDPEAELAEVSIFDITPTLLYGLGLPVAQDFPGRPLLEVFGEEFRRQHHVRAVPTWGLRETWADSETSGVDEKLIEELQALGYI